MSLTQLAFQIIQLSPSQFLLLAIGVLALGAVVSMIVARPKGVMRGGSFFGLSLLLHFAYMASSFVMRHALPSFGVHLSITTQIYSVLILVLVFGFFFGQMAVARARDVYGRAIYAYIAFIPLIGWLYFSFAQSQGRPVADEVQLPRVLKGGWAVLLGLACMVGVYLINQAKDRMQPVGLPVLTEQELDSLGFDASEIENAEVITDYGLIIQLVGLEGTLQSIAEGEEPRIFEDGNALLSAEAEGNTLTMVFQLPNGSPADDIDQEGFSRDYCQDADYLPIYEAGGTLKFEMRNEDKEALATIVVNQDACQAMTEAGGSEG